MTKKVDNIKNVYTYLFYFNIYKLLLFKRSSDWAKIKILKLGLSLNTYAHSKIYIAFINPLPSSISTELLPTYLR